MIRIIDLKHEQIPVVFSYGKTLGVNTFEKENIRVREGLITPVQNFWVVSNYFYCDDS